MKLSILIPTLLSRVTYSNSLWEKLREQCEKAKAKIEIIDCQDDGERTIGLKRNALLETATGDYICFIDDDDMISANYIELLMKAAKSDCDCSSLKGIITFNGTRPEIFEHSLKYKDWKTTNNEIKYERYPNHLNMIRSSIAKQFKFPETNHGEDHDWSTQLHKSGLLKTEYYIPDILYYYRKVTKNV